MTPPTPASPGIYYPGAAAPLAHGTPKPAYTWHVGCREVATLRGVTIPAEYDENGQPRRVRFVHLVQNWDANGEPVRLTCCFRFGGTDGQEFIDCDGGLTGDGSGRAGFAGYETVPAVYYAEASTHSV